MCAPPKHAAVLPNDDSPVSGAPARPDGGRGTATETVAADASDWTVDPTTEWSGETSCEVEERSPTADDAGATLELPPGAVARLDAGGAAA